MSGDLGMDLTVGLQKMRDVLRRHASPLVPLADELIDRVGSSEFYQRPPASGPLDDVTLDLLDTVRGGIDGDPYQNLKDNLLAHKALDAIRARLTADAEGREA